MISCLHDHFLDDQFISSPHLYLLYFTAPYIERCAQLYWTQQADLNSFDTVQTALAPSGVKHRGITEKDLDVLEAHQAEADSLGIIDAPTFVTADQIFWGREHLPWVNELLT